MGCEHIRNLMHIDDVELAGIADPNETSRNLALEACGDRFTPAHSSDYRDLLAQDLDAVIIASPNHTHMEVYRDLAASDLHILLEKPMCTTLADCEALIAMDAAREPITWVAMEYRYMSAIAHFLSRLPDIGELKMLFIREHRFPFLPKVDNWNRFNRHTGGTLVEKCCHFFDLMNLIIKARPMRVLASGSQAVNHLDERYNGEQPDILDNAFVIVEYDNGVRACLDLCMFAEGSRNEQELIATGSRGKLEAHVPENLCHYLPRDKQGAASYIIDRDPAIRYMGFHHGASYLEQLGFIEAIRSGTPPGVTTADGYRAVAVGVAAEAAIETGQVVEVSHR